MAVLHEIRIAVRELVEYVLRSGDIRTASIGGARAVDGTRAHQRFQKSQGEGYHSEVSVEMETVIANMLFKIHGRMDGFFEDDHGIVIDEIKTVGIPLEHVRGDNEVHWAQAKMYAYIYGKQNGLRNVTVRMTYIELEHNEVKHFHEEAAMDELESFYMDLLNRYVGWATTLEAFHDKTAATLESMAFPFDSYRKGQKAFMAAVYKTVEDGQKLFARAPTGIGKTVAALYPALKGYGRGLSEKVFYLTAKTIGKEVAAETLSVLESKGARIKRVVLTAKDKTCLNSETNCNPEDCPYANGHYDRVNAAVESLYLSTDYFSRTCIEKTAAAHQVCPYELSLDMALFSDVVICDYNYVFDPTAKLRRFFVDGSGKYTILVDEAHNLVDRGRDMYSASLNKSEVLDIRKQVREVDTSLYNQLGRINSQMLGFRKMCEGCDQKRFEEEEMPYLLEESVRNMMHRIEKLAPKLKEWPSWEKLLEFYFLCNDFVKKAEFYSDKYVTSYESDGRNLKITLFCLDPSDNLAGCVSSMKGVVFFSATLIPMAYYLQLLGGNASNYGMALKSPFRQENMKLLIDPTVSTYYSDREQSAMAIAERIQAFTTTKKGNYIVYFPSYKYLELVLEAYLPMANHDELDVLVQERGLTESMKEAFLSQFHTERKKSLVAFSVLGGIFGEGIDLVGEKLVGVVVVGVGLPQLCYERDLIKEHFAGENRHGFDYAYVFPGMNKVLQAAGRVIRTLSDIGAVLLIDKRYDRPCYLELFPEEWMHFSRIYNIGELEEAMEAFWRENDGDGKSEA